MDEGQKDLAAELNRLYWHSDRSVRQIRDDLDITSATLYDLLEPLPTGAACHVCGGAVGFKNRTARTNREGLCLRCGEAVSMPAEEDVAGPAKGAAAGAAGNGAGGAPGSGGSAPGEDAAAGEGSAGDTTRDRDWVSDAVDDALESTERAVKDVVFVAVGLVAVLAVGVVGLLRRRG